MKTYGMWMVPPSNFVLVIFGDGKEKSHYYRMMVPDQMQNMVPEIAGSIFGTEVHCSRKIVP